MKKLVSLLILSMFIVSLGAVSYQKTFLKDSIEWKAAEAIAIVGGVNPPTAVNPATGGEILKSIELIDYDALSESEKAFYDATASSLAFDAMINGDNVGLTPFVTLAPEVYAHKNVVEKERYADWLFPVRDRYNGFEFGTEIDYAGTFYGIVEYLMLNPQHDKQYDKSWGTNFDAITKGFNTQHEGTLLAGALIGNDWMNFSVQRSRQSLGYGKTGSLTLGDNFSRQDFMRLHTFSDIFDYTMNISLFSNMNSNNDTEDFNFNGMHNIVSIHRFDVKPTKNVTLTMNEGIVAYMDSTLDMRLLNPFLFHHGFNNYMEGIEVTPGNRDEANNILSIEAGWTVMPHLRVRGEFIFDQIQIGGETTNPLARPNANGLLVGADTSWIFDDMFLTAYAEYASTSPFLYLNYKTRKDKNDVILLEPNFDYILGIHDWWDNDEIAYGGYRFGGDAKVFGFGASFGKLDTFLVDASFVYSKHGTYGYGYINGIKNPVGPEALATKKMTGTPEQIEHRIEFKVDGSYQLTDYLELSAGFGFVSAKNYKNVPDAKFSDVQFKIGAAINFVEL